MSNAIDKIHEFDLPPAVGGGVLFLRELDMPAYNHIVQQASRKMPDGEKPQMSEIIAAVGAERNRLMRIACLHSIKRADGVRTQAWEHDDGPEGFIEDLGVKMLQYLDIGINLIHDLTEDEEQAFSRSHRPPGGAVAPTSPSGSDSDAQ